MFAVFVLILAPWMYRNYRVFNKLVPISTNGGFNFLMGNHVNSSGGVNFHFSYQDSLSEVEDSRNAYLKGINDIIEHPVESVIRLPQKIFFSYYRGDSSITWSLKQTKNKIPPIVLSSIFLIANYSFYIIVFAGVLCLISKGGLFKNSGLRYFMLSVFVYFVLIILIYVGAERYVIPLFPIHFYLASKYF